MKKTWIILLAAIIIFSGMVPMKSYGENGYDKKLEEAIIKTKKLFNISDEYDKFTSSINSYDEKVSFYLNWQDSAGNLDNVNVNIDIDGNIISFNSYPSIYKEPSSKLPNYTKDEAQKFAMEFIAKIDPTIVKEIQLIPENYPVTSMDTQYNFNYNRYVNDIQFPQNTVNISVDKYSGKVMNYYSNWDKKIQFPSPSKIISLDKGKEAFKKEIGLKPMYKMNNFYYRPIMVNGENGDYYLAYSIFEQNKGIDAFTGKKIDINYYGPYYGDAKEMSADSMAGGLTPEERESVDKLVGLLDEKTAEKKSKEILKIDDNYKLVNKNLNSNYKNPGEYIWNMSFQKELSKDKYQYVSIGIEAKTGELLNFYRMVDYGQDAKSTINRVKALEIAEEYIKKVQPDKVSQVELMEDQYAEDDQISYYFQFVRKTDNIYVENDRIYLGVDGVSGEVNSYGLDWYKGNLPLKDKLISIDKAYEVLWGEIGLDLMYIKTYDYTNPEKQKEEIKLVYSLNPRKPAIISGTTGELLDYSGQPYKEIKPISYNDIDKSYAKDKIQTLAEYGIGFKEAEFKPKDRIEQKDFVYLLWRSMNQYRTDDVTGDSIYKEFISMGYMKESEKNPNKIVTKEEGIKYIIKVMKLDKVAEIEGIYKDIFKDEKDISQGLKGYINIAYGLNIVSGDGTGNIKPKYELKREDAAKMIYIYLFD